MEYRKTVRIPCKTSSLSTALSCSIIIDTMDGNRSIRTFNRTCNIESMVRSVIDLIRPELIDPKTTLMAFRNNADDSGYYFKICRTGDHGAMINVRPSTKGILLPLRKIHIVNTDHVENEIRRLIKTCLERNIISISRLSGTKLLLDPGIDKMMTVMRSEKIDLVNIDRHVKRCPICNKINSVCLIRTHSIDNACSYTVSCDIEKGGCGASGGSTMSAETAIDIWNMRRGRIDSNIKSDSETNNERIVI